MARVCRRQIERDIPPRTHRRRLVRKVIAGPRWTVDGPEMESRLNDAPEPMMKLQPGGVAPVISYNVPEPTTYSGRNFIDLAFPASYFVVGTHPATAVAPSPAHLKALATSDLTVGSEKVRTAPAPLVHVDPDEAVAMKAAGKRLQVYRSLSGALKHTWVDQRLAPEPS